jgi:hypothetical protein
MRSVSAETAERVKALHANGVYQRDIAAALGIGQSTVSRLVRETPKPRPPVVSEIEFPDLPSSELPAEELIDQACKRFAEKLAYTEARRWFEIKVNSDRPIGVVFMGDPHIDNNGTNWPLLREHIRLLEETEGLYAIGGNDLTDNWIGRLIRLYADSEMSKKQAWKIAAWLMKETKIKWLCHIIGNHDAWGDGPYLLKANAGFVPVEDWQARFQLVFPNDARVRIHMAHDFPGTSQWNTLHGPQKAAMWGDQADIYACAHKHCWACHEEENPHRAFVYWLIRSRGYKFIDQYANQHGFGSQRFGASITAVIDPGGHGPKRIRCFPDVGEAAEFLTWKRAR